MTEISEKEVERSIHDVVATIEAGEFYTDYDQSAADLAILRRAAAALARAEANAGEPVAGMYGEYTPITVGTSTAHPAPQPSGPVEVKPLEWEVSPADRSNGEPRTHYGYWEGGYYHVGRAVDGGLWGVGAREIIANNILSDLTAAGYRILGPRQIDREKVARAICEAGNHKWPETDGYNDKAEKRAFLIMADAAIRCLTPGSMEGQRE